MHLRDRGRRQRLGVKGGEHLLGWRAQVFAELLTDVGPGRGRRAVLQLAEFNDPFRLEQVDAGGQHLAELDEGRTQFLQRPAHPGGRLEMRQFLRFVPVQRPPGPLQRIGQPHPAHHVAKAVADQDRGDVMQAAEVAHRRQCLPQHQSPLPSGWPGLT